MAEYQRGEFFDPMKVKKGLVEKVGAVMAQGAERQMGMVVTDRVAGSFPDMFLWIKLWQAGGK